jgi:hypothetical protein
MLYYNICTRSPLTLPSALYLARSD